MCGVSTRSPQASYCLQGPVATMPTVCHSHLPWQRPPGSYVLTSCCSQVHSIGLLADVWTRTVEATATSHTSVPLSGHNLLKTQATSQSQSSCGHSVAITANSLSWVVSHALRLAPATSQTGFHSVSGRCRCRMKHVIRKCFCFPALHVHARCENSLAASATPLTSDEMTGNVVPEPLALQSHFKMCE